MSLNRFTHNMMTGQEQKVNTRIPFPFDINMKKFTKKIEGVSPEYYQYELCGVVIHNNSQRQKQF